MHKVLEIVDLPDQKQVQLGTYREDERRIAPPVTFPSPLDEEQYQAIGWYFQDYLDDPSEQSTRRAEAVESVFRDLGRRLFEIVFQGNNESRSYYEAARSDGLSSYQLIITSSDSVFLALPWELLSDPEAGFMASRFASVVRRTRTGPLPQSSVSLTSQQLNVLLVSPTPYIRKDAPSSDEIPPNPPLEKGGSVGFETGGRGGFVAGGGEGFESLAIETLEVLDSLNVTVELDYLRPSTFAALSDHLASRSEHYHLVHFDGMVLSGPGTLVFESEDGGTDQVQASRVAELLAAARVPVTLLNAGRSDPVSLHQDRQIWAGTCADLAAGGVPVVVSAPFPLAVPARELFLRPLYQAIAQGRDIPSAVAQARKALMADPHRTSVSGKVLFWDWIGPAVYQSQAYTPASIDEEQNSPLAQPQSAQTEATEGDTLLPQGGTYGLVGRRSELRRLEGLFEQGPVVLLSGDTGVGKTELALGLAGWLQNTRSRTGGVFYTSFEVGAGLDRVIHEAGTSIAGLRFADMGAAERRRWLVEYLQGHPSLLIWDGLEHAAGFPGPDAALLEPEECSDLDAFLQEVATGGQTWVLLVGRRSSETWLSTQCQIYELKGLDHHDALELGSKILEKAGMLTLPQGQTVQPRLGPDYLELLELLEGHPHALQIALPLIKELPASVLVKELDSSITQLTPTDGEQARAAYLTALMDVAFSRMSRRSRVHLPFLSLFQRRAMLDILTHITQEQAYREVMSEELGWGACRTLLRSARDAGFLEEVTPSVYQIQPSLPWFYGRRLHRQVSASGITRLEQEFVRVYADTADYFMETLYENQDSGVTAVLAEEGNLTQALALALDANQWDSAQLLVQPLAQVYRMQKRYPELRRLRRQLLQAVAPIDRGAAEAKDRGGIDFWLYLTGTEASEAAELGELDHADDLNHQLLAHLTTQPDGEADPRVAAVHHQLGVVAQQRRQLEEAEDWFLKSLAIIERGEDKVSVADDYFCLGQVKHQLRRYTEAKEWFSKALEIHQRLDDSEEVVKDYRALGLASQYKLEHDEAESWYQRARSIVEENRDEETAVLVFHELGTVCHARYQYDEAENWYRQALTLSDRLGNEEQMAAEFHHLGLLAQTRELFYEDAEEWYLLALDKYEVLGDRKRAGDECRQLGILFHEQQRLDDAETWYHRAREIFEEVRDVQRTARTYGQLGVVAEERDDLPGALEWAARTYRLATDHNLPLITQVRAHLGQLRNKYGADQFTLWWQGFMASDPPTDLDVDPGNNVEQ